MSTSLLALAVLAVAGPSLQSQSLEVRLTPSEHRASVDADYALAGAGELHFRLSEAATVTAVEVDGEERAFEREGAALTLEVEADEQLLRIRYAAVFVEDLEQGEAGGEIHNLSVQAHVGDEGVFLAEDSAWHPLWVAEDGTPRLLPSSVRLQPIEGWAFVASGDPSGAPDPGEAAWSWRTPRPVAGVAVVGNRHEVVGRAHPTAQGSVQLAMHLSPEHRELAPLFLDAAGDYLDLYVPLLGAFPFARFSIVENFFSSGFAFPGFTLLGPRVVAMAPRSLAPGYLDHELLHSWWGNGVYVDPEDGNWCEALTTYSANYYRRIADAGEAAGRDYRRSLLMSLSGDPESLDDGALGSWKARGAADIDRFVGYEKGAFVFMMLEGAPGPNGELPGRSRLWRALARFAAANLGKHAGWAELEQAIEQEFGESRAAFFQTWVREHTRPVTPAAGGGESLRAFYRALRVEDLYEVAVGQDATGPWEEIDPNFRVYRVLPPESIIPTISGSFGRGGLAVETQSERDEVERYLERLAAKAAEEAPEAKADAASEADGENLLLLGHAAIAERADLIARSANPIVVTADAFEFEGTRYDAPGQAVLHSLPHPDRPGRFITLFHANGDAGWSRLRLIRFYGRDSTVVWDGDRVVARGLFEPSRKLRDGGEGKR